MNELPLQELFTRLREAGLVIGIDEYQLLLKSLQGGFGIADKAALKRLCQTLWVKSAEEKAILEYHFEQLMGSEAAAHLWEKDSEAIHKSRMRQIYRIATYVLLGLLEVGIIFGIRESEKPRTIQTSQTAQPTIQTTTQPIQIQTAKAEQNQTQPDWIFWSLFTVTVLGSVYLLFRWNCKRKAKPTPNTHVFTQSSKKDEIQVVKSVLQATSRREKIPDNHFILTSEFFPVTQRQMKQMWRYLRRPVREGKATELDVEATINQIGHQGILLEPVLVPPRINRAQLLLLIDQDGSMVPFHALSRQLVETSLRGGRLGSAAIYYFHNSPVEYLYRDSYHQQGKLVSDIITHICSERTAVLIFSDAGAARGGYSKERYKLTQEFLTQLQQRVRHIAWLNPMPRKRWFGTTAGEIASLVSMFEISRRGLQDAISVLRGCPTNFEGRRK